MDQPSPRILRDLNTDDLLRALGLTGAAALFPPIRRPFDGPSSVLAQKLAVFDAAARSDLPGAALGLLTSLGSRVSVLGSPPVGSGPRLFVANHPGLGDVLVLLSVLGTSDLRIVARDRPFLRALPGLSQRLILVDERRPGAVLGRVRDHLKAGGAVLTFPAGRIEADPAWLDPSGSWPSWSSSTAFWCRTVPGVRVQPCITAGVRARAFVDPWAARWRSPEEREWTAAVLQLVCQVLLKRPRYHRIDLVLGEPSSVPPDRGVLDALVRRVSRR